MATQFRHLFSPIQIGTVTVKNRIVSSGHNPNFMGPDCMPNEKIMDYWLSKAKGGAGMVMTQASHVHPSSLSTNAPRMAYQTDDMIPVFRKVADALHEYDCKFFPQLTHRGRMATSNPFGGVAWGSSPMRSLGPVSAVLDMNDVPHEMEIDEIKEVIKAFADAARRCKQAGTDGVEIQGCTGYLVQGFLSSAQNKRIDEYGGSLEDRMRFALEIIDAVRETVGRDFVVGFRMAGDEFVDGGLTMEDMTAVAQRVDAAGKVDYFAVCAADANKSFAGYVPPMYYPLGCYVYLGAAIKEVVNVPVMVVGRITNPRLAEDILDKGQADMVVMGRALIADPELPNKAAEGRFDDIAPCTSCGLGCLRGQLTMEPMTCVINPAVGREKEMVITPAAKPKKVLVAGGGPGGLEAARVAALRGHDVTLLEKEAKLGGQLKLAPVPPMKQELSLWLKYLSVQVEKVGVKVELNREVTPELIDEVKPDVVVVATGGEALIPPIPGVDGKKVVTAHDVLAGKVAIHHGNVLIIGGGMVGCEVADMLARLGDTQTADCTAVTIVEMLKDIGLDVLPQPRMLLMPRLREKGVKAVTSATVKEILEDGVVMTRDGQDETLRGMDYIILAAGAASVDQLSDKIKSKVAEVYVIGDAKQPRKALEAIAEGSEVARKI